MYKETCPYCGNPNCEADWVDCDVCFHQCGPFYCNECGASEIGTFDDLGYDRDMERNWNNSELEKAKNDSNYQMKPFKLPKEATITQEELKKGWFKPGSPMGSSVNTCNGIYVDHETARSLYKEGMLDEK